VSEARTYTVLRVKVTNVGIGASLKAITPRPGDGARNGPCGERGIRAAARCGASRRSGAMKENLDIALRLPAGTGGFTGKHQHRLDEERPSPRPQHLCHALGGIGRHGRAARAAELAAHRSSTDKSIATARYRSSIGTGVACRRRRRRAIDQLVEAAEAS